MNHINDARIKFYLEHEDRIKEWAAVKNDVPAFAHRFYLTLKDRIDEKLDEKLAQCLASDIVRCGPEANSDPNWWHVGLRRESWPCDTKFRPAIVLEWKPKSTGFAGHGLVYGCFNNGAAIQGYASFFEKTVGREKSMGWESGGSWFARRHLGKPKLRLWEGKGLVEYRNDLVDQLFDAWHLLSDSVDASIKAWKANPSTLILT